jgi:hypothetical protein
MLGVSKAVLLAASARSRGQIPIRGSRGPMGPSGATVLVGSSQTPTARGLYEVNVRSVALSVTDMGKILRA